VPGQHDGDVRGGPEDRRGQGGNMLWQWTMSGRCDSTRRPISSAAPGDQTRRRPVASFVMPPPLDICGVKTST
jgi:hypothetical protein